MLGFPVKVVKGYFWTHATQGVLYMLHWFQVQIPAVACATRRICHLEDRVGHVVLLLSSCCPHEKTIGHIRIWSLGRQGLHLPSRVRLEARHCWKHCCSNWIGQKHTNPWQWPSCTHGKLPHIYIYIYFYSVVSFFGFSAVIGVCAKVCESDPRFQIP